MNFSNLIKALIFGFSITATSAFAADGSSGCGPGWYLFKENSFVSSSLRSTTNGYSSPIVTLGMSFGTSNCAQHKIVMNDKRGLHFVAHNTHNLVVDVAMGRGESLGVLAETMGYDWKSQAQFNDVMKQNFHTIFGQNEENSATVYGHMIDAVSRDEYLSARCLLNGV
jgi:hypothetical protein